MKKFFRILRKTMIIIIATAAVLVVAGYLFMLQPGFGKSPSGARLERIEKSPRYRDGHFQNRIETPMYPPGESMISVMRQFLTDNTKHTEPEDTIPAVKRDLKVTPPTISPVVTWFGHSTTLVQVNGKNILTDPIFSERSSPVSWLGPKAFNGTKIYSVDDLPNIDAVIISHDHYDHLDYKTIAALNQKTKHYIVPLGVASHLEHWGIPLEKIIESDWWTENNLEDGLVTVSTPSRHFSGRGLAFGKTSWGSYVIKSGDYKVYFSATQAMIHTSKRSVINMARSILR